MDQYIGSSDHESLTYRRRDQRAHERALDLPDVARVKDHRRGFLQRCHERGQVVRVGAYEYIEPPPQEWPEWRRRRYIGMGKVLAIGRRLPDGHAVGGQWAAMLHELPVTVLPDLVEVHAEQFPSTRAVRYNFRRVVREGVAEEIVERHGIPVTPAARSTLECIRRLRIDDALVMLDGYLNVVADPVPWEREDGEAAIVRARRAVADLLAKEPGRRGNKQARRLLEACDGWAESPLESRARRGLLMMGLARPVCQNPVVTREGTFYPDITLTLRRRREGGASPTVHVEADGRDKYTVAEQAVRTQRRERAIRTVGHDLIRVTWEDVMQVGLGDLRRTIEAALPVEVRRGLVMDETMMTPWERAHFGAPPRRRRP